MREAVALSEAREPNAKYLAAAEPALVRGFELLSTAQGGVARLRQSILLLAVQGRLGSQEEGDEPAREALSRIRSAEARLIAEGKIKQAKADSTISSDEVPFEIPAGWAWARLSQLTSILNGRAYSKHELLDAGTPVLRVGNLFTSKHWYYSNLVLDEDKYCVAGDLLFAWSASFGPFVWTGPKVIYHYHIWKLSLHSDRNLDKSYLYTFLLEKTQEIKASGHGVSMIHMTKEAMEKIVVPVPPLAEQHRIVARVEELMKLCDALEQSGRLADEQHARLTSTLFDALAASESAHALAENWQRVAEHFDLLLDRPEAIDAFEQTIIQLAVHGRLVQQHKNDESAASLLDRIRTANNREITVGNLKRDKVLQTVDGKEHPFPLPEGWCWTRLGAAGVTSTGGTPPTGRTDYFGTDVAYVKPGSLSLTGVIYAEEGLSDAGAKLIGVVEPPSVLMVCIGGSIGKVGLATRRCAFNQQINAVRPLFPTMAAYLLIALSSADFQVQVLGKAGTSTLPIISKGKWEQLLVPMPPLAEQHRIVARVEELRRLCADLRQRLTKARETQSRLADALVAAVA